MTDHLPGVGFGEALRAWAYVGLNSFGGPAGQIAVMHREIVDRRKWLDESRFLHALNYAMLLPGPEAQELATYIGWLMHGTRGGLAAGLLFILPGALVLLALSIVYALYQQTAFVQAIFYGVKPAVVALIAVAVVRLSRRAIHNRLQAAVAVGAFVAIFFFDVPFPLIVVAAALVGFAGHRLGRSEPARAEATQEARPSPPRARRSIAVLLVGLVIWLLPVALTVVVTGPQSVFSQLVLFFAFAAVITFGGAYALLAYIAQQAVDVYGWLSPDQMLDGLGMAETTPGPLIMVVQFVAFMAAFGQPSGLDPIVAGVLASVLVTWVTFAPSFVWIFTGAPYVESLRNRSTLSAALSGVTAAVVGVIANLGVWFAMQTLFATSGELRIGPLRLHTVELASIDLVALGLTAFALVALLRLKWSLFLTLGVSAALGAAWFLVVGYLAAG
ncbi:MAG TPA: chromate efflux transporter [Candidatus Limnocylindrales bacterium]|nr:chromate efflux transporter [Candidatus Limnocylindrales bacterium]